MSYLAILLLALATAVSAHFQLQFPAPRGVFNMNSEPTFCDGYSTPAENRTVFPLDGAIFSLNSEHPQWTLGVILSNAQDPTSFDNFTQIVPFFQTEGEGIFCFPFNLSAVTNVTSPLKSGDNVTIQFVFSGGDGTLYQCADLTLSDTATVPSSISCTNATGSTNSTTSSSSSTSTSSSNAAMNGLASGIIGFLALAVTSIIFVL